MERVILNSTEFLLETKKSSYEKIADMKGRIDRRRERMSSASDHKKKRTLEIRNKIDYYKIKIEKYKDYIKILK